nr:MAG TPA: hypothetical protein [Bacteriophage sp.]
MGSSFQECLLTNLLWQKNICNFAAEKLTDGSSLLDAHLVLILLVSCISLSRNAKVVSNCELLDTLGFSHFFKRLHAPPFDI